MINECYDAVVECALKPAGIGMVKGIDFIRGLTASQQWF